MGRKKSGLVWLVGGWLSACATGSPPTGGAPETVLAAEGAREPAGEAGGCAALWWQSMETSAGTPRHVLHLFELLAPVWGADPALQIVPMVPPQMDPRYGGDGATAVRVAAETQRIWVVGRVECQAVPSESARGPGVQVRLDASYAVAGWERHQTLAVVEEQMTAVAEDAEAACTQALCDLQAALRGQGVEALQTWLRASEHPEGDDGEGGALPRDPTEAPATTGD